jgi:membrane protein implicated in regulation of membrane protease activity
MDAFQIYLVLGILLIGLEIFVPGFVLAPIGVAALATSLVAWFLPYALAHALTFALVALLMFWCVQRFSHLVMGHKKSEAFGLVGARAILIEAPVSLAQPGSVKVFADTFDILWDANDLPEAALGWTPGKVFVVTKVVGNKVALKET